MRNTAVSLLSDATPHVVTVLGSTGSIGRNTLRLVEHAPDRFRVGTLTAFGNVELLARQAKQFRPSLVAIGDEKKCVELKSLLSGTKTKIVAGEEGLREAAETPGDVVMSAMTGAAGLIPTLSAVRCGKTVAIANKECLVAAGELLMREARQSGATILPVDSEHNAVFQLFDFEHPETVEKITLTGSGGPFRTHSLQQMKTATPAEAIRHPVWSMGAKISVDSATLMNKGLEIIEACRLFPVTPEQVEVVIHPESVIHGMVHYADGAILAQLGAPDMMTPIACALAWPGRIHTPAKRLDFTTLGRLTFEKPDTERFPALRLARAALDAGGTMPAIMNAANEVAVSAFLESRISFPDIMRVVERVMDKAAPAPADTLDAVLAADARARKSAYTSMK